MVGNSDDETKFPDKLLLTNAQVSRIRKASVNGPSANIKFSKTQLSKMVQSGGFLFGPLNPLSPISSIINSHAKEPKNMGPKELKSKSPGYIFANTGLIFFVKKLKRGFQHLRVQD